MPTDTKLSVDRAAADVVRDEKRNWAAIEQRDDITNSAIVRLAFAFLRTFIGDPRGELIVNAWRRTLDGRADQLDGQAADQTEAMST